MDMRGKYYGLCFKIIEQRGKVRKKRVGLSRYSETWDTYKASFVNWAGMEIFSFFSWGAMGGGGEWEEVYERKGGINSAPRGII